MAAPASLWGRSRISGRDIGNPSRPFPGEASDSQGGMVEVFYICMRKQGKGEEDEMRSEIHANANANDY
ncbi:hypothetical protein FH972_018653 [Carpinus fangiana]|uniref:Uncharacterized protein n=1 Tax=Carpinus fangiana TaxID=176857 RepID=A0A5N6RP50_9ROSI|nr:hypothetical protein FH972_018653 [Carpinus fangiana]